MSTYKGFSFFQYQYNKSILLTDIKLVNRDLYNHIFTRVGDRIKMPLFGTRIPDMLFEQLNEELLFDIERELTSVFKYDPRVELNSIKLYPLYDQSTVYAVADLNYIEFNTNGRFDIKLEFEG